MISIITPVYNGERFIENCIQCVIDQNCSCLEHILVDGGSSDRTVEIIQGFAQRYTHIKWISEQDKGQSDAMNKGINISGGEIISFLNVDDHYEKNVLNRVSKIFERLGPDSFVVGNCNIWHASLGDCAYVNKPSKMRLKDLMIGWKVSPWKVNPLPANPSAYFYHKSLHEKIGIYDLENHYAMDLDFLLKIVGLAEIYYFDEVWGNFNMVEGSKTCQDSQNQSSKAKAEQLYAKHFARLSPSERLQVNFGAETYKGLQMLKKINQRLIKIGKVFKPIPR
jgi:glycosyltransferase involved in cell wall biosynthesis